MRNSRGFTLLEVLVVLAVIGGLMALATFGGSDRQAQDQTEQYARQLMAMFIAARQEAVFQNLDIGIAMDDQSIQVLNYQDINSQEYTANKTREELDKIAKNPWQSYVGPLKSELPAPDEIHMELTVEGQEVDFSDLQDEENGPKPALLFLSSDEYTSYELTLTHDLDERFAIVIKGDGFSEPLLVTEHFDG